jgi:hypothetical protein
MAITASQEKRVEDWNKSLIDAGFDGFIVLIQAGGEASQGLQRTGSRTREPRIELHRLPLTDQRGQVRGQVAGRGDLG